MTSAILSITKRQQVVLDALLRFGERHRRWPSILELARMVHLSKSTTYQHLCAMRMRGVVSGGDGTSFKPSDERGGWPASPGGCLRHNVCNVSDGGADGSYWFGPDGSATFIHADADTATKIVQAIRGVA